MGLVVGLALADRGSRWAGQIVGLALAVAGVGLVVSLSVSLVSPSRRHGDTAQSLVVSVTAWVSHFPFFFFFFSFFSFGFSVFAFSVWFWTAEAEIFSFIFIYLFIFCCGLTWVMAL